MRSRPFAQHGVRRPGGCELGDDESERGDEVGTRLPSPGKLKGDFLQPDIQGGVAVDSDGPFPAPGKLLHNIDGERGVRQKAE